MVWSTNYGRLLSQTVFTLFFAGRDFAPNCIIDGVNIQDYLQNHYIEACGQLADRIKAFDDGSLFEECIIGWDSMNEPFEGLCEWEDLNTNPMKQGSTLKKGTYPTPAQSLRLGMGQAQTVDNWEFGMMGPSRNGSVTIDPKGNKLWADPISPHSSRASSSASLQHDIHGADPHEPPENPPFVGELPDGTHPRWGWKRDVERWPLGTCIWAQHGVWDIETGYILRPDYFRYNPDTGIEIEFLSDYWKPHWLAYARRVRQSHEEAIVFVQPPVFAPPPRFSEDELKGRCAYSPHYYDGLTLVTRHWNWFNADALGLLRGKYSSTLQAVKIGESAIRKSLHEQLGYLQADVASLGSAVYPTVIGEIGTPFDMDNKKSYGWTDGGKYKGQYGNQEKALDASLNACDAWADGKGSDSLNWTVWTYVGDDHSHEWGDGWNMEDLSLWSPDDLVGYEDEGDEEEIYNAMVEMESLDENALNSRAALLVENAAQKGKKGQQKQPGKSLPMRAMMSSLSLATLGVGSASATSLGTTSNVKQRLRRNASHAASRPSLAPTASSASSTSMSSRRSSRSIAGYSSNPYTLLTNGARAVRAFARPWPVKVVGRATDVRFDVGKGLFKMIVSVGWDDRIRCRPSSSSGVTSTKKGGANVEVGVHDVQEPETDESLATEVYIPLVHYAHARLLEDKPKLRRRESKRRWVRKDTGDGVDSASISSVGSSVREGERARTTQDLSMSVLTTTTAMTSTSTAASSDSDPCSRQSLHSGSTAVDGQPRDIIEQDGNVLRPAMGAPLLIRDSTPDLVDVEVKISGGRFVVRGQTLFWWYDAPSSESEPRREYTLEVKRRGGILKPRTKGRKMVEEGSSVWCEELCPEDGLGGCVIA